MRINKFIAENTNLSRRKADDAIRNGDVTINDNIAQLGDVVSATSTVFFKGNRVFPDKAKRRVVIIDKPVGYVCSRDGQGSPTVYDLVSENDKELNIAGRLDKDSRGLVILTNDGELLNELTHPRYDKEKAYIVTLDRDMNEAELKKLSDGVDIGDQRPSTFYRIKKTDSKTYEVVLKEGRNRQIRRTFSALNAAVLDLHRTRIGNYTL